jgi:DNA-binding PadR family transcriptional regulator
MRSQPTYAYDLAQRFERRYGEALQVSSIRHIYTALSTLTERGYAEEIPGTREGRQPRPRYRATEKGIKAYGDWLVGQVREERHRREVFVLALAGRQADLQTVMKRCEEAWVQAAMSTTIARDAPEPASSPVRALIAEEDRLAAGAKLAWIEFARQELMKLRRRR